MRKNPFVGLVLLQLAGILTARYIPGAALWGAFVPVILLAFRFRMRQQKFLADTLDSILVASLFIGFFVVRTSLVMPPHPLDNPLAVIEMRLLEKPTKKKNSWEATVRTRQADPEHLAGQKMIVYLGKSEKIPVLRAGDIISGKVYVREIVNRGNPWEFDYKAYMNRKGIFFTGYLPARELHVALVENPPFLQKNERFREKLTNILRQHLDDRTVEVAAALTLGYREELSPETRERFINTGAMHVLSVSGMHVGMIFLILNMGLKFLKRLRNGHFLFLVCTLLPLWGYALLTGFSPPAARATVMFSVFLIGNSLRRSVSGFNALAASAFLLLLVDSNLVYDVGFQLSYLAMIGILFFYPRFEKLLKPHNRLVRAVWQLTCLSFSAQICIFPISVCYFHQFPMYFWLSNLLVAPVAYLYLGLTAGVLLFPFDGIASALGHALCLINRFTLYSLGEIGHLPGAVADGFSFSFARVACLYAALAMIMGFLVRKRYSRLFIALSFLAVFQAIGLTEKINLFNQQKVFVYRTDEQQVIHFVNGRKNYLISDSENPPLPYLYRNTCIRLLLDPPLILHRGLVEEGAVRLPD